MTELRTPIFTIGHSDRTLEDFVKLLKDHKIAVVFDVRSVPYSRRVPQFNRENLDKSLRDANINYVYLGAELGGRPADPSCYNEDGKVAYDLVAKTRPFKEGLQRVVNAAAHSSVVLMCVEKDPLDCHRALLVGHALHQQGYEVQHILEQGNVENHGRMLKRLLQGPNHRKTQESSQEYYQETLPQLGGIGKAIDKAISDRAMKIAWLRKT